MADIKSALRALCTQAGIEVPTSLSRLPGAIITALSDEINAGVGTPAASAISGVSMSTLNLDRMTMDSPDMQIMGPPVAGPSGHGHRQPKEKGTFPLHVKQFPTLIIDTAILFSLCSQPSKPFQAAGRGVQASVQGCKCDGVTQHLPYTHQVVCFHFSCHKYVRTHVFGMLLVQHLVWLGASQNTV
jgi:hypothetical protein